MEQLDYIEQGVEKLKTIINEKGKISDSDYLALLHINAVINDLIKQAPLNKHSFDILNKCTRIELMGMVCALEEENKQLNHKLYGMETTIANLKEFKEKQYEAMTYDNGRKHRIY